MTRYLVVAEHIRQTATRDTFASSRPSAASSYAAEPLPTPTAKPVHSILLLGAGWVISATIKDRLNDTALSTDLAFPVSVLTQGWVLPLLHRGNYATVNLLR